MKILVSGFETFNRHEENSSQIIAQEINLPNVISVVLPVEYENAFLKLKEKVNEVKPDYIVCLGLAGKRDHIELEKVAINLNHATIPDNAGTLKTHSMIQPNGDVAHFSTLPLEEWLKQETPFPVTLSLSAGSYVCNDLFYRLMDELKDKKIKAGFLHLPHLNNNKLNILETIRQLLLFLNNV